MTIAPKKDGEKYYIYKTTNLINGKYYVGFHKTSDPFDNYLGSGVRLIDAIKKYGVENFKKEILFEFDTQEEAEAKEREIVNLDFVKDRNTYNVSLGGNVCVLYGKDNGFYGKTHTKETKEHISQMNKGTRRAFNHILEFDGKIFHGYDELLEENLFPSITYIKKAIICGVVKFIDPYLQMCLNAQRDNITPSSFIKYDLSKAKEFADKWNAEHGYDEFIPKPRKLKEYKYTPPTSSTKGKHRYWNIETLEQKYFKDGDPIPNGWVKGKPKDAIERDKNKRKPSFEKGTMRVVYDPSGKRHYIPINDPLPDGWYNTRPDFLPKLKRQVGTVMIVNDEGRRRFINKDETPPNGWKFATVTKGSIARRKLKELQRKESGDE